MASPLSLPARTYQLKPLMADRTDVYDGAGRVYPPGTDWEQEPLLSPLRLAHDVVTGKTAARALIGDVFTHGYSSTSTRADDTLSESLTRIAALEKQLHQERIRHSEQLAAARKRSREPSANVDPFSPELFPNAEEAVRFAVLHTWVHRVPIADKPRYPLGEYLVGAPFPDSLTALDDGQRTKAFKCIVDVVTDRARTMASRQVHPLRTGIGGDDAPTTRGDGAVCYRASIEASTASARRLHYWKLSDGRIELSRIVTHDDVNP